MFADFCYMVLEKRYPWQAPVPWNTWSVVYHRLSIRNVPQTVVYCSLLV